MVRAGDSAPVPGPWVTTEYCPWDHTAEAAERLDRILARLEQLGPVVSAARMRVISARSVLDQLSRKHARTGRWGRWMGPARRLDRRRRAFLVSHWRDNRRLLKLSAEETRLNEEAARLRAILPAPAVPAPEVRAA